MATNETSSAGKTTAHTGPAWLNDGMMNLLVDYYTEVPFRPYGSGATRENVVPFLKELELGYLIVYAKGHSGVTAFPSSLKTEHPMLAFDQCQAFREYTREAGTRLTLYYSGLLDGVAGERHPEWRMKNPDGTDKRMFEDFRNFVAHGMCPLSGYWDQWVTVHLRELVGRYQPDAIWVDGDWPGPCYCPRCQARFRADTGLREPWDEICRRPDFLSLYQATWNRIESEWRERFSRFLKELKPDIAYSAGNVSARREYAAPFDWRSGDFFSPNLILHDMARMMRWYGTMDLPYDAYICDTSFTHARKSVRSRTKTLDRMLQEAATVAATGGQVGYWTFPLGNGAWVPSRMRKAIAVRRFLKEREDLFRHSRPVAWTTIVNVDPACPAFLSVCTGSAGLQGAHRALAALHRSPQVMDDGGLGDDLPSTLIVVPEETHMSDAAVAKLAAFVEKGGSLLTSGCTLESPAYRKLLGVKSVAPGAEKDGHVLLRREPFGEPTGSDNPWDRLELGEAEALYPLYRSWDQANAEAVEKLPNNWPMHGLLDEEHPEPAGCPAAVVRRHGKGRIVHIATDIFSRYVRYGDPQMLRWLREIVEELDPEPRARTDAPSWVDLSLRRAADGRLLVHFVNQNPGRDLCLLNSDDLWVDEIPEVGPYRLDVRLPRKPRSVRWEPGHGKLAFTYKSGRLNVEVPRFKIHGCVAVEE